MALNSLGLGFVFTATDLASGKINNIARTFGGMDRAAMAASASYQRNFAQLGAGAAIMGTGLLTLAGGFALANSSSQFSNELARVGGVAQATTVELGLLRQAALDASMRSTFTPQDAVTGLGVLAQAGMNATQSIASLRGVLDFAGGGQVGIETSANAISSALRVFSLEADKAGMVADMFLRITNSTALGAADMEQAMGSVSRGVIATHQSIEDILPAIGLVKNTGVDVSVAAQSVSSALVFMSSRAAQFKEIGVDITDSATGEFRNFLDIIRETQVELEERYPNAAERAAKATDLFSRFGLQAYAGVSAQLTAGVRDSTGRLYQNAEAVTFLRGEMEASAGAAAEFNARMLETFEGRKAALSASLDALKIVLGEGFEEALKPIIAGITEIVRSATRMFNEIPLEMRGMIAQFVLFAGVVTTLFGAFVAGKAIFALLAPFIGSITVAFTGLLASLIPVTVAFATIVAIGAAVSRHLDTNAGAAGSLANAVDRVKLGFRGLFMLVSTGRLSGGVLAELNKTENAGLKRFIGSIVSFGFRIAQFFRGIKIGFNAAIDSMRPTFERFGATFSRLKSYILSIFGDDTNQLVSGSSRKWLEWGAKVGQFIGKVVDVILKVGIAIMRFTTGFIGGFRAAWKFMGPLVGFLVSELGKLWDQIVQIGVSLGLVSEETGASGDGFEKFGQGIGGLAGGALGLLAGALGVIVRVLRVIIAESVTGIKKLINFVDFFFDLGATIAENMLVVKMNIMDMVDTAIMKLGELMSALPPGMRPQFANDAIAAGREAEGRQANRVTERMALARRGQYVRNMINVDGPSNAEARMRGQGAQAATLAMGNIATLMARQAAERRREQTQPIILQIDGEAVATAVSNANRNSGQRGFTPSGGEEG